MFFQCKWVFRLAIALLLVHFAVHWNDKSNLYKFIGYRQPRVSLRINETSQKVSCSTCLAILKINFSSHIELVSNAEANFVLDWYV
jgi:hypothetical protein